MKRAITYSLRAKRGIEKIATYIGNFHGEKAQRLFKVRIERTLEILSQNPTIWPTSHFKGVAKPYHKAIVYKRTIILYTFNDDEVFVDLVFDTRTDWL